MAARYLTRLQVFARQLGGELRIVDGETYNQCSHLKNFAENPFRPDMGLDYKKKIVYATAEAHPGALIHELGHVFATPYGPHHRRCNELRWLGWEIAVARHLQMERVWQRHMAIGYFITDLNSRRYLGEWTQLDQERIATSALAFARLQGIISRRNVPNALARS